MFVCVSCDERIIVVVVNVADVFMLPVVVVLFCPLFFGLCNAHQSKDNDDDDDDSDDRFNCNKLIILYVGNFEKKKQQKHK